MKLYAARHGETDLNIDDRFQGAINSALNMRGRSQANDLTRRLPNDVVHLVSSPLRRAVETAEIIATERQLPMIHMPEFRERRFGVLEGLTQSEAEDVYPEIVNRNLLQKWDEAPQGAETIHEVSSRVLAGIAKLRSLNDVGAVVLVTHGFVIRILQHLLQGIPAQKIFALPRLGNGDFIKLTL
jgi:broad specificity phosphatase PhoE